MLNLMWLNMGFFWMNEFGMDSDMVLVNWIDDMGIVVIEVVF